MHQYPLGQQHPAGHAEPQHRVMPLPAPRAKIGQHRRPEAQRPVALRLDPTPIDKALREAEDGAE